MFQKNYIGMKKQYMIQLQEGAGLKAELGHVDFFPNGGTSQPGCQPIIGGELADFFSRFY